MVVAESRVGHKSGRDGVSPRDFRCDREASSLRVLPYQVFKSARMAYNLGSRLGCLSVSLGYLIESFLFTWRSPMRKFSSFILFAAVVTCSPDGDLPADTETAEDVQLPHAETADTPQEQRYTISRLDGGSMQTVLSRDNVLNDESSLRREWVALHEPSLPISMVGTPGVTTVWEPGGRFSASSYQYQSETTLIADEDVAAVEIRFLLFNVFGERMTTLSATEVADIPTASEQRYEWAWNILRQNDTSEFYASIAFIAYVRTISGEVYEANWDDVLTVAGMYANEITEADLNPPARP